MGFNHNNTTYNKTAAKKIVPIIIQSINPKSVIDIGCGIGTWLNVFSKNGIDDYLGVDGDYVNRDLLHDNISEDHFYPFDLKNELNLRKKYGLVVSLEVAEHIEERYSDNFIRTLINHGDTILFSAAIPYQGGENHVNEQWLSYWIKKFEQQQYFPHDMIRPLIWNVAEIEFWYKQNIVVFKKGERSDLPALDMVHPSLYELKTSLLLREIESYHNGSLGFMHYVKIVFKVLKIRLFRLWKH